MKVRLRVAEIADDGTHARFEVAVGDLLLFTVHLGDRTAWRPDPKRSWRRGDPLSESWRPTPEAEAGKKYRRAREGVRK